MEGIDGTALSLKLSYRIYRLMAIGFHPKFAQGLREVREETGIELASVCKSNMSSSCDSIGISSSSCLGLWESVYPPVLTQGSPIRHHIVIYLCMSVSGMSIEEVEERIKLDPVETDAALWVRREFISELSDK